MSELKVIQASIQPINTNVLWLNNTDKKLYKFSNNGWEAISGNGGVTPIEVTQIIKENTLSALDKTSNKPVSSSAVAKESIRLQSQINNIKPIEITGDVTNAPDEEDITTDANNLLKLKDRPFGKGLGHKILRADKTFAEQVTDPYTIYEVRYDFDLGGETFELPTNCVLRFAGGKLSNGEIQGVAVTIDATYKIFDNIVGNIDSHIGRVHTYWFGYNTSNINEAIRLFTNSEVYIDTGEYTFDETVNIPYDTAIDSGNVIIKPSIKGVVFKIWNADKPIRLGGISVFPTELYEGAIVEYRGYGYKHIRGFDSRISCTTTDVYLPCVIGRSQASVEENDVVGCKLITADYAESEKDEYHYIYYKRFYGTFQSIRHGLYIDPKGDTGTLTTNEYHITSWWCKYGVTTTIGLPMRNNIYINYQSNSYCRKIYYNENFEPIQFDKEDASLYVDIYDEHAIPAEHRYSLIDGQQFINVSGICANGGSIRQFLTKKDYPHADARSVSLNNWEYGSLYLNYGNQRNILIICRDAQEQTFEGYLKALVNYFNHNDITRSLKVIYNCGLSLTSASPLYESITRILANSDTNISNTTIITLEFMLPMYGAGKITRVIWKLQDAERGENKTSVYSVNYDADSITLTLLSEKWDGIVIESIEHRDYGCPNNTVAVLEDEKRIGLYNSYDMTFIGADGNPILPLKSLDDFKKYPYKEVGAIYQYGNGVYQIISLGSRARFRFEFSSAPLNEDAELAVSIMNVTYNLYVSAQPDLSSFISAFKTELNKVITGCYAEDISFSGGYLYVSVLKFFPMGAGALNSYTVTHNGVVIATSRASKYGGYNSFKCITPNCTSDNRPSSPSKGDAIYDETLGRPIWWTGTKWVDATGTAV